MASQRRTASVASAMAMAVALCAQGAHAQDQAQTQDQASPTPSAAPADQEIIVTGSRISRRDYTSSSPIVTTSQASIEASGQVNIEQSLQQLPQFSGGRDATVPGIGNGGYATVNLRGLGENRNLVLLDGHRLPIATNTGATDINLIPPSLLSNVEVISGGASAVYGSDAISGVVNFKTRRLDGIEIDAQRSVSGRGDAALFNGSLSFGTKFAGGRGHIFATGAYTDRDTLLYKDRSFFYRAGSSGSPATGSIQFVGGAPSQAALNTVFSRYGVAPGSVSTASRIGFNNDGTLYSTTGGYNFKGSTDDYGLVSNQITSFTGRENYLIAPQQRYNGFAKVDYELTPDIQIYLQGLYANTTTRTAGAWAITAPSQLSLPVTNPFIPADLATLLASRPGAAATAPVLLFKGFKEVGKRIYTERFESYQIAGGIHGKFGSDWTWDVYGSYDQTRQHENINHVVLAPRVQKLLNAADGGNSICAGGYNPFGESASATISQACVNYITAPVNNYTTLKQGTVEASLQGALFDLPAGPVKLAVTADYRENTYNYRPDILIIPNYNYTGSAYSDLGGTLYPNSPSEATNAFLPSSGRVSVKEIAGEMLVPLLKDSAVAKSLNVTLGGRYSSYNLAGDAFTYKAEFDWRPISALLFRGGYEHALRAPNVAELFSQSGTVLLIGNPPGQGDPCDARSSGRSGANASSIQALCLSQFQKAGLTPAQAAALYPGYTYTGSSLGATIYGNTNLQPEKANTLTMGAVLSPRFSSNFLRNIRLSVDYYHIQITNQIATVSGTTTLQKCFNYDGSNPTYDPNNQYCSTIVRSPGSGILFNIGQPYLNLGGTRTSGLDFQFDADLNFSSAVSLNLNSVVSYLIDYSVKALPGSPYQNYKGTVSAQLTGIPSLPEWRSLTTATLRTGPLSTSLRWRHIAGMKDVSAVTTTKPAPGVPAYDVFDLFLRLPVTKAMEVRGGVNNLLDVAPLTVGGITSNTNATLYDVIGRSFYFGVKVRF